MWYPDEATVRLRIQELRREAQQEDLLKLATAAESASTRTGRRHPVRSAGATGMRWLGERALALADRLDSSQDSSESFGSPGSIAFR